MTVKSRTFKVNAEFSEESVRKVIFEFLAIVVTKIDKFPITIDLSIETDHNDIALVADIKHKD